MQMMLLLVIFFIGLSYFFDRVITFQILLSAMSLWMILLKLRQRKCLLLWAFLLCVITVILVDFLAGRDAFVQDKMYQWVGDV